eukprot:GDKI01042343.1.p1 GENE.GDKI01042343.1~~GDKI01042343.1.p1  ORF type:complete len:198 (-),score=83.22 GDKI01042343.1:21-614(-)
MSAPAAATSPGKGAAAPAADVEQGGIMPQYLKNARHPMVCVFHLLFKAGAFFTFLFGGLFGDYITTFVITTLFLAFDFWTVKNVTGRMLVGMRWWNDIKEDGTSEWVFESIPDERVLDATDKTVFWGATYVWPLVWLVFFIIDLIGFQFDWLLLVIMGLSLSMGNLIGYWKCSKDQKKKMKDFASAGVLRAVVGGIL